MTVLSPGRCLSFALAASVRVLTNFPHSFGEEEVGVTSHGVFVLV